MGNNIPCSKSDSIETIKPLNKNNANNSSIPNPSEISFSNRQKSCQDNRNKQIDDRLNLEPSPNDATIINY